MTAAKFLPTQLSGLRQRFPTAKLTDTFDPGVAYTVSVSPRSLYESDLFKLAEKEVHLRLIKYFPEEMFVFVSEDSLLFDENETNEGDAP